jgi:hypothetical protein
VCPVTFQRLAVPVTPPAHVTEIDVGACVSLVSVMTKCHIVASHE